MWCNHTCSQRNKATKKQKGEGQAKFEKGKEREYKGNLHKILWLGIFSQL